MRKCPSHVVESDRRCPHRCGYITIISADIWEEHLVSFNLARTNPLWLDMKNQMDVTFGIDQPRGYVIGCLAPAVSHARKITNGSIPHSQFTKTCESLKID